MDKNLYLMNLESFKGLLNFLIERREEGDENMVQMLQETFKLNETDVSFIVNEIHSRSPLNDFTKWLDDHDLAKVQGYIEILELKPRNYDEQDPDLLRLKKLVQNKIRVTMKEVRHDYDGQPIEEEELVD